MSVLDLFQHPHRHVELRVSLSVRIRDSVHVLHRTQRSSSTFSVSSVACRDWFVFQQPHRQVPPPLDSHSPSHLLQRGQEATQATLFRRHEMRWTDHKPTPALVLPMPRPSVKFPRYPLSALFVILSFAGLGTGLWSTNRELTRVRQENDRLKHEVSKFRREMGHLEITDDKKIHAIALPSLEDLTWRWRIYVPQSLELHWGFDEISNEGLHARYAKVGARLREGEQVLTCAIRKSAHGDWLLLCQSSPDNNKTGVGLPDGCEPWFTEQRGVAFDVSGVRFTQVVSEPSEPLVLLRQREHGFNERSNDIRKEPPTKKRDGLLLWIAPRSKR